MPTRAPTAKTLRRRRVCLWMGPKAGGHGRYNRFNMLDVANIPARMVGEDDVYARAAQPRRIARNLGPAFAAADGDAGPDMIDLASPSSASAGSDSSSPRSDAQARAHEVAVAVTRPLVAPPRSPPVTRRGRGGKGRSGRGRGRSAAHGRAAGATSDA